ncbi:MAG: hypothetical protein HY954_13310 [Deltaproteobacteria bacterium]|nr:hypothetical protein [Deltaproteobacteria bacterium]
MAFSANWTDIADSQIDADSPLDTALMGSLRDNEINLKEWMGKDYTPEPNHSHDGVNSRSVGGGQLLLMDKDVSTNSTSFVTVDSAMIYIPEDLLTLTYYGRTKVETTGRADMRLAAGTTNGTTVQGVEGGADYAWNGPGTIDVSSLSGWQEFNIQMLHTTGLNAFIQKVTGRMT